MDCDLSKSTCGGSSQKCIAFGPGTDMKDSTFIIGKRQFLEAKVIQSDSIYIFTKGE